MKQKYLWIFIIISILGTLFISGCVKPEITEIQYKINVLTTRYELIGSIERQYFTNGTIIEKVIDANGTLISSNSTDAPEEFQLLTNLIPSNFFFKKYRKKIMTGSTIGKSLTIKSKGKTKTVGEVYGLEELFKELNSFCTENTECASNKCDLTKHRCSPGGTIYWGTKLGLPI